MQEQSARQYNPPALKSKLVFMDYCIRKPMLSPLYLSDEGTDPKTSRQISKTIVTFGREGYRGNDVQVARSTTVSRRQCVIVNCRDNVWRYHLESAGTHLNGQRVKG